MVAVHYLSRVSQWLFEKAHSIRSNGGESVDQSGHGECGKGNPAEALPLEETSLIRGKRELYGRIARSSLTYTLSQSGITVLTIVVTVVLYRLLGPDEVGKLAFIMGVAATGSTILMLGLDEVLAKFIPQISDKHKRSELYSLALLRVFTVFFLGLIGWMIVRSLFRVPEEVWKVYVPLLLFIGATLVYNINAGFIRGVGRFNILPWLSAIRDLLPNIIAIGILALCAVNFEVVFYTRTLFLLFLVGVSFVVIRFYLVCPRSLKIRADSEVEKLAIFLLVGALFYTFYNSFDVIILRSLLTSRDVGHYAAATRFPKLAQGLLLSPLQVPFLYYFSASGSANQKYTIMKNATRIASIAMGALSLVFLGTADILLPLLLGSKYLPSVAVLKVYSPWIFLQGFFILSAAFFVSENRLEIDLFRSVTSVAVNVVLYFILIPRMGASGAALAIVLALSVSLALLVIILKRWFSLDMVKDCLGVVISYGFAFVVGMSVSGVLSLFVFVALIGLLRLTTLEEISQIFRFMVRYEKGYVFSNRR